MHLEKLRPVFDFFESTNNDTLDCAWLGQAGFALRWNRLRLLIDPYLSDILERKYRGTPKPHERLMSAPVAAEQLHCLDYVLCTHRHSDHMDPETLPLLASLNQGCQFVVPSAERKFALAIGLADDRLILADAGARIPLLEHHAWIEAIPAAHDSLEKDENGRHRYLGYILHLGKTTIYHSGDTVSYPGLAYFLRSRAIDLALLPVNGRGEGVPGNFTFEEAVQLCEEACIPSLIPHHFGMFAFNTVDRAELVHKAQSVNRPNCFFPECGRWFQINTSQGIQLWA